MDTSDYTASLLIWTGTRTDYQCNWWHVAHVIETIDGRWWNGFVKLGMN